MKKIYLSIIVLLVAISSQAQVPQAFSYQAVIRNTSNVLVANQLVGEKISLLKDSATGTVVYSETQSVKTNANGLVSLQIGTGSVLSGSFSGINWATGTYFINIETDPTGGGKYTISNTTQLLSVPYALQAGNAPSLEYPDGLSNLVPIILDSTSTNFTVPDGKNFYCNPSMERIKIDVDTVYAGGLYYSQLQTILLKSGQVVSTNIRGYNRETNTGFLVDKTVEVVYLNLANGKFIVPNGKIFVFLSKINKITYNPNLLINGIDNPMGRSPRPMIFPSGTVFSGSDIINGYLK